MVKWDYVNSVHLLHAFAFPSIQKISSSKVTPAFAKKVRNLVGSMINRESFHSTEFEKLVKMGKPTPQALMDHALELEIKAKKLKIWLVMSGNDW